MPALGLGLGLALDSGAGNPDGLSLDLQFATDKTLTARKGPTPTFTRASSATQVGSTGLIEYAPENLALQSENFGTTWANNTGNALTLNDALSPTETLTADRIDFPATAAAGLIKQIQQSFSGAVAGNGPVTASVWLRTVSGASTVYLTLLDGGAPWQRVHVACNVTTAWTRFSVTLNTPTLSLFMTIGPDTRTTNGTPVQPAVQDAASVYAWGAQLERSSTARTYIPTTTAAVYDARFDHDPVTLACKGLLIEESRTNLAFPSENFASASWTKTGGSLSSVANVRPDGNANSELFSEDGATSTHRLFQVFGGTIGTIYTLSVFFKFNGRAEVALENRSIAGNPFVVFNIQNGTIGFVSAGLTAAIQAYPNGWYRCSITGTATLAGGNYLINGYSGTTLYTGLNGPAFYLYGAQLEAGAFPSSYIPTTTASVVRSQDICSITGSAFTGFYNASEGTINAIGILNTTTTNPSPEVFKVNDGTNNNRIQIGMTNSPTEGVRPFIGAAGVITYNSALGTATIGVERKIAMAYKSNDAISVFNGTLGTQDTSVTIPTGINQALIGVSWGNGTIASIRYFKKRLPNAKLQTLTT